MYKVTLLLEMPRDSIAVYVTHLKVARIFSAVSLTLATNVVIRTINRLQTYKVIIHYIKIIYIVFYFIKLKLFPLLKFFWGPIIPSYLKNISTLLKRFWCFFF